MEVQHLKIDFSKKYDIFGHNGAKKIDAVIGAGIISLGYAASVLGTIQFVIWARVKRKYF